MHLVSAGPLPSGKSMNAVSKDRLVKAYYQTTSMRDVPGRAPSAALVGENFADIHNVGRKSTKYLEFQHSRSPLTNREACQYSKDFMPLPLADHAINKALAEQFKAGRKGGVAGTDAVMDGCSMTETAWPAPTPQECRNASQKVVVKAQEPTQTLGGCGLLLETTSHQQRTMVRPDMKIAKAERAAKPRPYLGIGANHAVNHKSATKREFHPGSGLQSVTRSASTPDMDTAGLPPLNMDPEIFRIRRAPNMMPGR